MAGMHNMVMGRGITDSYIVTSGFFDFTDGKGGTVKQNGYSVDATVGHGSINRTQFNIKAGSLPIIRTENVTNYSSNTDLLFVCSKPAEGLIVTNNGWSILRIEHIFSGSVWTYKRTDAGFSTYSNPGTGVSIGEWYWNLGVKGTGNADAPFRNVTSGQNTYRVYAI